MLPEAKLPDPFPEPPKKKRGIVWNDLDTVIDQGAVLTSGIATVRRQQIKVLKAFQQHLNAYKKLTKDNHRIHSVIKEWLETRKDMKAHALTKIEAKQLLVKPDLFQPDDVVDPDSFHFGFTHMSYRDFIQEQEQKAKFKCPVAETLKKKSTHSFRFLIC